MLTIIALRISYLLHSLKSRCIPAKQTKPATPSILHRQVCAINADKCRKPRRFLLFHFVEIGVLPILPLLRLEG